MDANFWLLLFLAVTGIVDAWMERISGRGLIAILEDFIREHWQ